MNDYENNTPNPEQERFDDNELKKTKKNFSLVGFSLLTPLVLTVGAELLMTYFFKDINQDSILVQCLFSIFMYLIAIPAGMLILRKAEKGTMPNGDAKGFMTFFVCLCITVQLSLIGYYFSSYADFAFSGNVMETETYEAALFPDMLLYTVLTLVVSPVIEELFFRRMLCDVLKKWGWGVAVLMSALFYAFFHSSLSQFFYAFAMGLVLSYTYLHTGKVRYPIIIHIIFNLLFTTVPMLVETQLCDSNTIFAFSEELSGLMNTGSLLEYQEKATKLLTDNTSAVIAIIILGIVSTLTMGLSSAGTVFLFLRRRKIRFKKSDKKLPAKYIGDTVFLAPGILLFITVTIILTVISIVTA